MGVNFRKISPAEASAISTIARTKKADRVVVYRTFIKPTIKPTERSLVRRLVPNEKTGVSIASNDTFVRAVTQMGYRARLPKF